MIARRRLHRVVFALAGLYNLAWGMSAVVDPQWLFRMVGIPPQSSPQIFAALGMVVGLYGILYLEIARVPERGWLPAAIGLLGKVLGPVGLAYLIVTDQWPVATALLVLTNDVVWWIPFALYLHDAWPHFRSGFAAELE
jgi:hypothetical protein